MTAADATRRPFIDFHVDGKCAHAVVIPDQFVRTATHTVNLTRNEIGGGAYSPVLLRGKDLFAQSRIDEFDECRFLTALRLSAGVHLDNKDADTLAIDIEGGFHPWAEKTDTKYKGSMTDDEYEIRAKALQLQMLDAVKVHGMDAGFWGRPWAWEGDDLIRRDRVMYGRCGSLHPELYIRHSGDHQSIFNQGTRMAGICACVQREIGQRRIVNTWHWDRNSTQDLRRPGAKATVEDMVVSFNSAVWAIRRVQWLQATTSEEAADVNNDFKPGGRLHELFTELLSDATAPGADGEEVAVAE